MVRGFSQSVSQSDLVWHRDRENRTIIVVEGRGWQFQRDNCLPELIREGDRITVSAGEYHRLIKGDSDLIVTIIKEKKKLSPKQKKIAQAAPPPDEITGADFKALNKKKKVNEDDTPHEPQYDAPQGSKRDKQLDKFKNMLKRAKELAKKGKTGEANKLKQRVYKGRDKMEKEERDKKKKNESLSLSRCQLSELISETVEAEKLAMMLEKIEELEEKKKRKKKKKKKKGGGLSAAVKKSLDKKADRRGLTRGSVYAEFRKGLAAFYSSGSRKGMTAHQWAHARVNSANPRKKWAVVKKRKGGKKKKK